MQLELYLRDNPGLKMVEGDQDEAVLVWAAEKKYIILKSFNGHRWYTEENLSDAKMWAEKTEYSQTDANTGC